MLELHVWGPGLSLPSIDPHCLAAIAYLNLTLPPTAWTLIHSSNPLLSPSKSLPALRTPSNTWHTSLPAITRYLASSNPDHPGTIDSSLSPRERAAATALTAHLNLHAQELCDLLLYISPKNFTGTTRPLFAQILPWPVQYYLPLQLRAAAEERTRHLGLTFPAVRSRHESALPAEAAVAATIPAVQSIPAVQAREEIRLRALVDAVMRHVETRLERAGTRFLFSDDQMAEVDCVAVGYLAVLLNEDVEHGFVRDAMGRWGRTREYVERGKERAFAGLPVGKVERGDLGWFGGVVWDAAKGWVGMEKAVEVVVEEEEEEDEERKTQKDLDRRRAREWWKSAAYVVGGVVGFLGYMVVSGMGAAMVGEAAQQGAAEEEDEEEEDEEEEDDDDDEKEEEDSQRTGPKGEKEEEDVYAGLGEAENFLGSYRGPGLEVPEGYEHEG